MPRGGKGGRKKRARTFAEKLLMSELSDQLYGKMKSEGWDKKRLARELGVCLATAYNYLNQDDLAGHGIFRKTHEDWDFQFRYLDFGDRPASLPRAEELRSRQYVMQFLESVRENDVEVIKTKPVKSDTLQLTIQVKFSG